MTVIVFVDEENLRKAINGEDFDCKLEKFYNNTIQIQATLNRLRLNGDRWYIING